MNIYKEYVKQNIDERTVLEQLAEESNELAIQHNASLLGAGVVSKNALKLIRAKALSNNPTPIDEDEAINQIKKHLYIVREMFKYIDEEYKDMLMCIELLNELGIIDSSDFELESVEDNPKWQRWAESLGYEADTDNNI